MLDECRAVVGYNVAKCKRAKPTTKDPKTSNNRTEYRFIHAVTGKTCFCHCVQQNTVEAIHTVLAYRNWPRGSLANEQKAFEEVRLPTVIIGDDTADLGYGRILVYPELSERASEGGLCRISNP